MCISPLHPLVFLFRCRNNTSEGKRCRARDHAVVFIVHFEPSRTSLPAVYVKIIAALNNNQLMKLFFSFSIKVLIFICEFVF